MLKISFNDHYVIDLPEGHRFPMEKYALLPMQLMHEGIAEAENFHSPRPISRDLALAIHTTEYLDKLDALNLSKAEIRRTGFPLSSALVQREKVIMAGTVDAVDHAMTHGVAGNAAGGTHHAFADRGEGFCLLNDVAIATKYAMATHGIERVLVVDLDVHQGNGTAKLFENEPRVFTFSVHGAHNYPMHKENSDIDVPLPDGTEDKTYLRTLQKHLTPIIEKHRPELLFYISGVDVLKSDRLGRLSLSIQGCKARDEHVFEVARSRNIPVVFSLGGGYSKRVGDIVDAHAHTFRVARDVFDL